MPSVPFRATVTGPSTQAGGGQTNSSGYPTWFPDHYGNTPFNIGIGVTVNSTGVTWNIEHTFDYLSNRSSNFNGFLSSGATWFQHSTLSAQSSNASGNYAFPVTAIRLNVTAGSSTGTTTVTLIQAH
jgi:hypothetical protein